MNWGIAIEWFFIGFLFAIPVVATVIANYGDGELNESIARLRRARLELAKSKTKYKLHKFIHGARTNGYVIQISTNESEKNAEA